jgi:hypothetical protein
MLKYLWVFEHKRTSLEWQFLIASYVCFSPCCAVPDTHALYPFSNTMRAEE